MLWRMVERGPDPAPTPIWWNAAETRQLPAFPAGENPPWACAGINHGEIICFSSLDALPADADRDVETFRTHGIKSNLTLPLMVDKEVFGALAFATTRAERSWEEDGIMQLRLLAQLIGNVMGRQRAELREEQLRRELSHAMRVATLGELAGLFSTKATGLGRGLSICQRILEHHSRPLDARNHPDGGAVFTLTMPVRTPAAKWKIGPRSNSGGRSGGCIVTFIASCITPQYKFILWTTNLRSAPLTPVWHVRLEWSREPLRRWRSLSLLSFRT